MILFIFVLFDGLMGMQDVVLDVVSIFCRNGFNFEYDVFFYKLIFFYCNMNYIEKDCLIGLGSFLGINVNRYFGVVYFFVECMK